MPLSASSRPRNMFPPPTTAATWTPSLTTATTSLAMRCTTVGEMPSGSSPENASPDSLTTTRRHGRCARSFRLSPWAASTGGWPLATGALPPPAGAPSRTAEPSTRGAPSPLSALLSTRPPPWLSVRQGRPSACLADLEAGERPYRGALLAEHLLDRLLGLLDERLLDERDVLEERAQPALDNLGNRLLRLALIPGDLFGDAALVLHDVGRHLVTGYILRPHRRDLLGDVLARLLVRRVQLDEHAHGRRQRSVGAVQVAGDVTAFEQRVPAEFQ